MKRTVCLLVFAGTVACGAPGAALMPWPAEITSREGRCHVDSELKVTLDGAADPRLERAVARFLRQIELRTGLTFARDPSGRFRPGAGGRATLVLRALAASSEFPQLGEDESYTLEISPGGATLDAPTTLGVLRGLATLEQWLVAGEGGWHWPAVSIADRPRFPWRGLMIDVSRHFQPLEVIRRQLDGMALVKLNVLHLHLSDDQGFRVESGVFPRLHELGSDGDYFTRTQIRELIDYAAERGIRVVPEFDVPGHISSWLVGHPELGSAPGPHALPRGWGVFDAVLDPTRPATLEFIGQLFDEMAALFPDRHFHVGGDENNGVQWTANAEIQEFVRRENLGDHHGLQAWFMARVQERLSRAGKAMVGWDEILHPSLPPGSVVQSWRGSKGVAEATAAGFPTLLSHGYYIDLCLPAAEHYANDPAPAGALTAAQEKLVLGGEATMWSEWVTPETIDSRIWPRTAAIAERLWSPRAVNDAADMYRRLAAVSRRLEESGLQHLSYVDPALRRLAGDDATPEEFAALRAFVDLVEPVKRYRRKRQQPHATQFTPLNGLVDCAWPDSEVARRFVAGLAAARAAGFDEGRVRELRQTLRDWHELGARRLADLARRAPRLREMRPLLEALATASTVGLDALELHVRGVAPSEDWLTERRAVLDACAKPHAALELPTIAPLRGLLEELSRGDTRPAARGDSDAASAAARGQRRAVAPGAVEQD